METTRKRLRIINKSKESITIDIRNAGGIIKMSWNIFRSLFNICEDDTKFCQTIEEDNCTYNKFRKLLSEAVSVFSNIKDAENPDKKQLETLGKCFNNLTTLLNCSKEDLNELIIDKYNDNKLRKQKTGEKKKNQQNKIKKVKQVNNTSTIIPSIPVSTFGDLEALKQLKKRLK